MGARPLPEIGRSGEADRAGKRLPQLMDSTPTDLSSLLDAVAFAARAHRHQLRKDGVTPYVSHPIRVAWIAQQVFGVTDRRVLTAAMLHDTVEDTTTDCDDILERFGPDVARWVAALTKDKRLPEQERENAYAAGLAAGGWQIHLCKLADIYDNLLDSAHLSAEKRQKTFARSRFYLAALEPYLTSESRPAFNIVRDLLVVKMREA
jgi:guanosine-3',5'-bis(diphosphate) 3'-pyrophosphohydrolase